MLGVVQQNPASSQPVQRSVREVSAPSTAPSLLKFCEQRPCCKRPQHLPEKGVGMNCPILTSKAKGAKEGSWLPSSQWDLQMRGTSLPKESITGG